MVLNVKRKRQQQKMSAKMSHPQPERNPDNEKQIMFFFFASKLNFIANTDTH